MDPPRDYEPDRGTQGQRRRILERFPSAVFIDEAGDSGTFAPIAPGR